jgi:hypothetical protein
VIKLFLAEWLKISRNVRLAASLVWIFPIGAATILAVGILINVVMEGFSGYMSISRWPQDAVLIWGFINTFPGNVFGRMLPLAFMAVVFAGEYQWGTWKNVVPRSNRARLVIAKLIALTLTIVFSLALASLIIVLLQWFGHSLLDVPYEPAWGAVVLTETLKNYFSEVLIATLSLLMLGSFAALAAFITRSVLGALLLSFGFSIAELLSLALLALLAAWFDKPGIVNAYRYMPSFNLENLHAWMVNGQGYTQIPLGVVVEASVLESLVLIGLWIALLSAWAISLFKRQDITS